MDLLAFPVIFFIEKIQDIIFPFLESVLPKPIGGFIAIVISVVGGVVVYLLIIGLLMYLTMRILILLRPNKRENS